MRIALVFLILLVISIGGVGLLALDVIRGDAAQTAAPPASQQAAQPAPQQPAPQQPVQQPQQPRPAATARTQTSPDETITFTIKKGETTGDIARRLTEMGLVSNATIFRLWVQFRGAEGRLQAGDYQLHSGMSMDELIEALQTAKAKDVAVTFVEGRRMEEFADALRKADVGIDADRFLDLAKRGNFTYDFLEGKPTGATLEGYLFPDTYRVIPGKTTPDELIHQMLKRFGETLTPQMRQAAQANKLSVHQLVTLAAIVEREAQVKNERTLIAAVYVNRLRINEPLGADAAVQYAIGKPGDWWPQLRDQARNIEPRSPYNTYTNAGLPPGPIASPGAAALKASAEPDKSEYLFYVRDDVKNDGSHVFARTLAEHEANIRRYQRIS
jgi:UPF0755 protein